MPGVLWSPTASEGRPRGMWSRLSGADLGSVLGHVGAPPGGSEASHVGCRASFFPLPFLRRRSYIHSRNNCGNSRSGLVWSGLVWSALFLCCVAVLARGCLADRQGAVTTWLVSSPLSGARQTNQAPLEASSSQPDQAPASELCFCSNRDRQEPTTGDGRRRGLFFPLPFPRSPSHRHSRNDSGNSRCAACVLLCQRCRLCDDVRSAAPSSAFGL